MATLTTLALQEIANKRLACLEDMAKIASLEDLFGVSMTLIPASLCTFYLQPYVRSVSARALIAIVKPDEGNIFVFICLPDFCSVKMTLCVGSRSCTGRDIGHLFSVQP